MTVNVIKRALIRELLSQRCLLFRFETAHNAHAIDLHVNEVNFAKTAADFSFKCCFTYIFIDRSGVVVSVVALMPRVASFDLCSKQI